MGTILPNDGWEAGNLYCDHCFRSGILETLIRFRVGI